MPIPEFITTLRASVGHELLWMSGVSAVVLDEDGGVLLGRRADNGRWAVPSGILEPGEEPGVAVAREVLEETGVMVEVLALTAVTVGGVITYPNGDRAQYLDLAFWCTATGGDARVADDESTAVGWYPLDALPDGITASSRARIDHTLAYRTRADGSGAQPYFVRA